MKDKVLAALKSAGKDGLPVRDVWFYTTGKKVKEIKKVGPGRFGLKG